MQSNGWGSIAVMSEGAPYGLTLRIPHLVHPAQLAVFVYGEDDTLKAMSWLTYLGNFRVGYTWDLGAMHGGSEIVDLSESNGSGGQGYPLQVTLSVDSSKPFYASTLKLGFWAAGVDQEPWEWELDGEPDAVVAGGSESGTNAMFVLPKDLPGGVGAELNASANQNLAAGARAKFGGSLTRSFDHGLVGMWFPATTSGFAVGEESLTVGRAGSAFAQSWTAAPSPYCIGCANYFEDSEQPNSGKAGSYTFSYSGFAAGAWCFQDGFIVAVDLALPR
jgi:hypothetical protein